MALDVSSTAQENKLYKLLILSSGNLLAEYNIKANHYFVKKDNR